MWSQLLTLHFVHLFTLCIFIVDTRAFSISIAFLPKSDFGNLKSKEFPLCQKDGWGAFLQHLTRRWEYHWTTRKDDCWKGFTYELSLPVMHAVLFLTPKQPGGLIWQINNWKKVVTWRLIYVRDFFLVFSLGFWQMDSKFFPFARNLRQTKARKTIPDSRPKSTVYTVFRPKRCKNPTLWGSTYLYGYISVYPRDIEVVGSRTNTWRSAFLTGKANEVKRSFRLVNNLGFPKNTSKVRLLSST